MNTASLWPELAREKDVTVLFTLLANFFTRMSVSTPIAISNQLNPILPIFAVCTCDVYP